MPSHQGSKSLSLFSNSRHFTMRLFTLKFCIVHGALLAPIVILWYRSCHVEMCIVHYSYSSQAGPLQFCARHFFLREGGLYIDSSTMPAEFRYVQPDSPWSYREKLTRTTRSQFAVDLAADRPSVLRPIKYSHGTSSATGAVNSQVSIHLWIVVFGACLPGSLVCVFKVIRHRYRLARTRCVHCGYDLRASMGDCPECGMQMNKQKVQADG